MKSALVVSDCWRDTSTQPTWTIILWTDGGIECSKLRNGGRENCAQDELEGGSKVAICLLTGGLSFGVYQLQEGIQAD